MYEKLRGYLVSDGKDASNSHANRAKASFHMLAHVDDMIQAFKENEREDHGSVLLDVFGLLQGLFVAIDALYDLAIGLTSYKYHINVNQNDVLHELKFVRNDIVGHPTHRTYHDGGTGFSMIDMESLSRRKMTYRTYVYKRNDFTVRTRTLAFPDLVEAYRKEKEVVLKDLDHFLEKERTLTDLPEKVFRLYETLNLDFLEEIKKDFIETYDTPKDSHHRFLWRLNLLRTAIGWREDDEELNRFIWYICKKQAAKLHRIALGMANRNTQELYTSLPDIVVSFYRFMRREEEKALPLLDNIHDPKHPFFESDLEAFEQLDLDEPTRKIADWLKRIDQEEKIYLIGSILREYRPKQS